MGPHWQSDGITDMTGPIHWTLDTFPTPGLFYLYRLPDVDMLCRSGLRGETLRAWTSLDKEQTVF